MIEPTTLENIRLVNWRQKRREGKGVANCLLREWMNQELDILSSSCRLTMEACIGLTLSLMNPRILLNSIRTEGIPHLQVPMDYNSIIPGLHSSMKGVGAWASHDSVAFLFSISEASMNHRWRQWCLLPTHKCHQTLNTFAFPKL